MIAWLFGGNAYWFSVPAALGTLYFVLEFVMEGLGGDTDVDTGSEVGVDGGESPAAEFRVLSLQTISAFAMAAGWIGLASLRFMNIGFVGAAVMGGLGGVGVAWVLVWLMRSLAGLQSSGNIPLVAALGERGTVCVRIPPSGEGSGRVSLVVRNRQREFNAVQRGGEAIPSNTRVRVLSVDDSSNTVMVEVAR